mmetsp:Transcript_16715/g.19446  ORF Transcript_16715/g.19446 Transcript_16715/m.19446 type:complete len:596 (+) Transcript_16715:140-1927(+)
MNRRKWFSPAFGLSFFSSVSPAELIHSCKRSLVSISFPVFRTNKRSTSLSSVRASRVLTGRNLSWRLLPFLRVNHRTDTFLFPNRIEGSKFEGGLVHTSYFLIALTWVSIQDALIAYYGHKKSFYEDVHGVDIGLEVQNLCNESKKRKMEFRSKINKALRELDEAAQDIRSIYNTTCHGLTPSLNRMQELLQAGRMRKLKKGANLVHKYHDRMYQGDILEKPQHMWKSEHCQQSLRTDFDNVERYIKESSVPFNSHTKAEMNEEKLYKLDRMLQFASLSYGWKSLYFLGLCSLNEMMGVDGNVAAIGRLVGVSQSDILSFETKSQVCLPGHFVAIDHEQQSIVVSVRGTSRFQDIVTSLTCRNVNFDFGLEFQNEEKRSGILDGTTHDGFLTSAYRLDDALAELVLNALDRHPGYSVETTGHSLGGACASLLALLWSKDDRFRSRGTSVHAYTYGSPGVLCNRVSQSDFVKERVTSVVLGEDIVTRLSLGSYDKFVRTCEALSGIHSPMEDYINVEDVEGIPDVLFPAGELIHIPYATPQCDKNDKVLLAQNIENHALANILITKKMFKAHLPSQYLNGVRMQTRLKNNHYFHLV